MKKTILQKLFDGEINPSEYIKCTDPKYRKISDEISEITESFAKSLSKDDQKIFININEMNSFAESLYNYEYFVGGFRLGVTIMLESLGCKLAFQE